jgi:DMSO/TMAO reductase YedYZ molybdopterin-dependent catalytic subunit
VIEPDIDFDNWTLTVAGAVSRPGDYKLEQIQALPKARQNTRHVCVEAGTPSAASRGRAWPTSWTGSARIRGRAS